MKRCFITGTGTGVGKTFFTCALTWQLRQAGVRVRAVKPVVSGFSGDEITDTHQLLMAQYMPATPETLHAISPWRFAAPLSPNIAAAREGREIDIAELVAWCRGQTAEVVLIEGVGGIMVPLNDKHTVLDWMAALECEIILVAGSYLGTISHTLTALAALAARGLAPSLLVVSESLDAPMTLTETIAALRPHVGAVPMLALPRASDWKQAVDVSGWLR